MMVLLARRYHFERASSSAVEQETLNLLVQGSNPCWLTRALLVQRLGGRPLFRRRTEGTRDHRYENVKVERLRNESRNR